MEKKVEIVTDSRGNKVVKINAILFKGKRRINWDEVKVFLAKYVGDIYEVAEDKDVIILVEIFPMSILVHDIHESLWERLRKLKQMHRKVFLRCLKLQQISVIARIRMQGTSEMLSMGGIDMILDLLCLYWMNQDRLRDTTSFVQPC